MRQLAAIAYVFLLAAIVPAMADGSTLIDFEHFPGADGIIGTPDDIPAPSNCSLGLCGPLSNEFSSMGITFTRGTLFKGSFFPGTGPNNHYISSTPPDATFSRLVTGISITSYSFWTATLYALDENDNIITSNTLTNPNPGSSALLGTLSVSGNRPIRRFTVLPAGCQIGGQCSLILNLDNLILTAPATQFSQQGPKLVGIAAVRNAFQGYSVALSADGSTAIVGGPDDNWPAGAAWVYVRNGGVWTQQGAKLVGTDGQGQGLQGTSVSLSADGNTAIVGGPGIGTGGGVWFYTRSGGVWSQQGPKLSGADSAGRGNSVAVSADGNTVIVGGYYDNSGVGAAWVYTRSGGVWSQQGPKLVGTGAVGAAQQGFSVAISGDGNTAIVGGPYNNSSVGTAWFYTRSGGVWSQQGPKLVGTGAVGPAQQGFSVALSGDGNTAIVGGLDDNSSAGAAWFYTRSGGVWVQQGLKLVGTDAVVPAHQGVSASLSGDGNTAIVGGYRDDLLVGAAWVYKRNGGAWTQEGAKLVGTGAVGTAQQGLSVALAADGNTGLVGGYADDSNIGATWVFAVLPVPPTLVAIVSRKVHGGAGTFDLPLWGIATNPTTEPRQGPAQTIVFTFDKAITGATVTITEGAATAATPTFSGSDVIVDLTGVIDQQYVTISLTNVASSDGGSGGSGLVRVGYLVGDVNQNRVVSVADLGLVNAQLAQSVTAANYLRDVNASGTLTVADKGITNANLSKALPAP